MRKRNICCVIQFDMDKRRKSNQGLYKTRFGIWLRHPFLSISVCIQSLLQQIIKKATCGETSEWRGKHKQLHI